MPPPAQPHARTRCVFTSAGDRHAVAGWLPPDGARDFDLFVAFYGEDEARFAEVSRLADRAWRIKGGKAQNLHALVLSGEIDLSPYTHVWLPDDDLLLDPRDIPRLFDLAGHFGFAVCQPAFHPHGRVSLPITRPARNLCEARATSFVEMTCPLFRGEDLGRFLRVFDGSLSGWGLDLWFCHELGAAIPGRFGVIDAITVFNPHNRQKPGGFREIERLRPNAARVAEYRRAAKRHGLPGRPPMVSFHALPLPEGWAEANPPFPDPRPFPAPSALSLDAAERAVLAAALSPAPGTVAQWGADGLTAAVAAAGAGLVVAAEPDAAWLRSCLADRAFAAAHAAGRLVFVTGHPPARPGAPPPAASPWQALAERAAWPDLLIVPGEAMPAILAEIEDALARGHGRASARLLMLSEPGAPAGCHALAGTGWRSIRAAGRLSLLVAVPPRARPGHHPTGPGQPARVSVP